MAPSNLVSPLLAQRTEFGQWMLQTPSPMSRRWSYKKQKSDPFSFTLAEETVHTFGDDGDPIIPPTPQQAPWMVDTPDPTPKYCAIHAPSQLQQEQHGQLLLASLPASSCDSSESVGTTLDADSPNATTDPCLSPLRDLCEAVVSSLLSGREEQPLVQGTPARVPVGSLAANIGKKTVSLPTTVDSRVLWEICAPHVESMARALEDYISKQQIPLPLHQQRQQQQQKKLHEDQVEGNDQQQHCRPLTPSMEKDKKSRMICCHWKHKGWCKYY